jgi:hypothetical protein
VCFCWAKEVVNSTNDNKSKKLAFFIIYLK